MIASQQEIRKLAARWRDDVFVPSTGPKLPPLTGDARLGSTHAAWTIARGTMRIVLVNMLIFIFILLAFSGVWLPKLTGGIN